MNDISVFILGHVSVTIFGFAFCANKRFWEGGFRARFPYPFGQYNTCQFTSLGGNIFRIGRAAHFEHMSMHVLNVIHLTHIPISIHMHMFTNSILDVMNVMSVVCECNE